MELYLFLGYFHGFLKNNPYNALGTWWSSQRPVISVVTTVFGQQISWIERDQDFGAFTSKLNFVQLANHFVQFQVFFTRLKSTGFKYEKLLTRLRAKSPLKTHPTLLSHQDVWRLRQKSGTWWSSSEPNEAKFTYLSVLFKLL